MIDLSAAFQRVLFSKKIEIFFQSCTSVAWTQWSIRTSRDRSFHAYMAFCFLLSLKLKNMKDVMNFTRSTRSVTNYQGRTDSGPRENLYLRKSRLFRSPFYYKADHYRTGTTVGVNCRADDDMISVLRFFFGVSSSLLHEFWSLLLKKTDGRSLDWVENSLPA